MDLSAIQTELTKAYQADDAVFAGNTKGVATVRSEELASIPNLVVPADYKYCDKSW